METARAATRDGIRHYWEIVADAERVLDDTGGECTPDYDALEALAESTVEWTCEQLKLAIVELREKAEANKRMAERYRKAKEGYEGQANRLRQELLHVLGHVGKDRVETESGSVAVRQSARVEVDETDRGVLQTLSDMFLAEPTWKIDRKAIAALLKRKDEVPGCRLVLGDPWVDVR